MELRIPKTPPAIAPLPDGTVRPRWSVMLPSYNCSQYLKLAIESVLVQDQGPENMQIEVVDDCSTDVDVEALVKLIGKGRVGYYRQPVNRGSLRNFETCLNRAQGQWIHLLHGDDLVLPGFYEEIETLFTKFPEAGAAFTGFSHMDEEGKVLLDNKKLLDKPGIIPDWLTEIASSQQVQPPAVVVKREVYENLGGFYAVHYAEDWEMWVRIAAHYPVAHSPRRLALYRIHNDNITSRYFKAGQSILDIQKVIDLNQQHLPINRRAELKRAAREHFSRYFARMTDKVYHEYQSPARAMELAKDSFRMHANSTTVYFVFKIYLKRLIKYKIPG